jgi:serine/threonine-protein kinase
MAPPATIGPYRLLERVSVRPLTETWRAEQPQLARSVLVKTLKATVAPSSPFAEELDREAHVLSRVAHEGVVQLYEYVRNAEHVYLVLEDAGGHGLDAVLERAPALEPLSAVAIALELARALGNAHALGVVHRSLRPGAVVLTAGGRVVVGDFSGAQQARLPTLPEAFEVDAALAAPDYLAPEQILGEEVGAETDVFALGIVLHEMVAGARPFRAPDGHPASSREVALRIRNDPPPSLGQLADNVPRSLERAVLRCLAKRREDRFPDGRALAAALEEILAEQAAPPVRVLVSRAIAAAKLGDELPAPGSAAARTPVLGAGPRGVWALLRPLLVVFVLIVAGGTAIELGLREEDAPATSTEAGPAQGRGWLKVLARPWAEVYVDGELVETTPVARPIPVEPGKRFVTFKHPAAPEEKRTVKVVAGQTVVLDITMRVERPDAGVGPPDAGSSP